MLFNSYAFLFGFLPGVTLAFFAAARASARTASVVLVLASLFFYGWWNPKYVPLLLCSAAFNYAMSRGLLLAEAQHRRALKNWLLGLTIGSNLLLLAYFKYYDFFVLTVNAVSGLQLATANIVLPLGISFFTFTQIAFVVDTYRAEVREQDAIHYLLFVTWFPHLIAGPILHHKETMPQFANPATYRLDWLNVAMGSAMFTIGIFKKVVLADGIGYYVSSANALSAFTKSSAGLHIGFFDAWAAALAYTLQLYFDFSGYSDMAIGLSLLFGVKFPLNFNSPYQAVNIIEFWRRWHMTLSRFLRDYLYFPLGGSRRGAARRYLNLIVTMLLGGLWHGAGWTFIVWGLLHGLYLAINHAWRSARAALGADMARSSPAGRVVARLLTFAAVVVGWVFFRSTTLNGALDIVAGMAGLNGFVLAARDRDALGALGAWLAHSGVRFDPALQMSMLPVGAWLAALLPMVWWAPNSQQIMGRFAVALREREPDERPVSAFVQWQPTPSWAFVAAVLFTVALLNLTKPSEFLYFQF